MHTHMMCAPSWWLITIVQAKGMVPRPTYVLITSAALTHVPIKFSILPSASRPQLQISFCFQKNCIKMTFNNESSSIQYRPLWIVNWKGRVLLLENNQVESAHEMNRGVCCSIEVAPVDCCLVVAVCWTKAICSWQVDGLVEWATTSALPEALQKIAWERTTS